MSAIDNIQKKTGDNLIAENHRLVIIQVLIVNKTNEKSKNNNKKQKSLENIF